MVFKARGGNEHEKAKVSTHKPLNPIQFLLLILRLLSSLNCMLLNGSSEK